jgi:hypothetical protein
MKEFISFGSIGRLKDVVKDIEHATRFMGVDEEGTPIFSDEPLPIVKVTATEKIHGTNASVCYNHIGGFWVQSRKNIITPEKDNAGCAFDAYQKEAQWMSIINTLASTHNIDLSKNTISVYYEWCGDMRKMWKCTHCKLIQ